MEELTEEPAELVERVAALDIGKASLVCCVRVTLGDQRPALKKDVRPPAQAAQVPGGHWHGVGACRKDREDPQPRLFSDMAREGDSGRPLRHRRRRRYRRPRPVLRAEAWPGCR